MHYTDANPKHQDRFAAGNARLETADGGHRAFIDPRCVKLIEDLETRGYKAGTTELADGKEQGHVTDAWSYPIHRIWPIRFNVGAHKSIVSVGRNAQTLESGRVL